MRQNRTIIYFHVFTFYQFCSVYQFNTEMLKFKPVHAYFAQVCSYCSCSDFVHCFGNTVVDVSGLSV